MASIYSAGSEGGVGGRTSRLGKSGAEGFLRGLYAEESAFRPVYSQNAPGTTTR
jgi:hypothetical protein